MPTMTALSLLWKTKLTQSSCEAGYGVSYHDGIRLDGLEMAVSHKNCSGLIHAIWKYIYLYYFGIKSKFNEESIMIQLVKVKPHILAILLFWIASAVAGEPLKITFELEDGKEYQVCVDYTANLNSVQTDETISCVRPLNPQFEKFSKPTWKELDPSENVVLYSKTAEIGARLKYKPAEEQQKIRKRLLEGAEKQIARGKIKLLESMFDINNDGQKERVINVIDQGLPCRTLLDDRSHGEAEGELFGLDKDGQPVRNLHPLSMRSNPFFYDGRTFLDTWVFSRRGFEGVLVYRPETASTGGSYYRKICRIFANH